ADPRSYHTSRAPPPELRGVADGPHTANLLPLESQFVLIRPRAFVDRIKFVTVETVILSTRDDAAFP
ncbi:hypothetical protein, partial [Caballeronia arationis]|uniref:hypothetical protein n=1 Tax=Caballeronia arationis TaxID=1777142 RepID=UPI001F195E60